MATQRPGWDSDSTQLQHNLTRIAESIYDQASNRGLPSLELPKEWHRIVMEGLNVPDPEYVGNFRGEPKGPLIEHCAVVVRGHPGAMPWEVARELETFLEGLHNRLASLDSDILPGKDPDNAQINRIIELAAWVHGEWVRIHPFANGNGRTARIWANWVAVRYGLDFFVTVRPRPGMPFYGDAAQASMKGNHKQTEVVFKILFSQSLRNLLA